MAVAFAVRAQAGNTAVVVQTHWKWSLTPTGTGSDKEAEEME